MSLSWSENLRGQLDLPLGKRQPLFMIFSILIGIPLSMLWAFASSLRMRKRMKQNSAHSRTEPWMVSIGNVSVGGTGKSPVVRALARKALEDGFDVAVLSRGHGASTSSCSLIQLSGQDDAFLFAPPAGLWTSGFSDECLEHALVLGTTLKRNQTVWVAQASNRAEAMSKLLEARQNTSNGKSEAPRLVVLLDDGLSQTSVPVHRDIVVWDPATVISAPRAAMPFGPYRMGWPGTMWSSSLPTADLVVWSRIVDDRRAAEFQELCQAARKVLGMATSTRSSLSEGGMLTGTQTPEFFAVEQPRLARVNDNSPAHGFVLETVDARALMGSYSVLTGLARPHRFIATIMNLQRSQDNLSMELSNVESTQHLSDHGSLTPEAIALLEKPGVVVTSLKDLCRWWGHDAVRRKMKKNLLYVLCLEVELRPGFMENSLEAVSAILRPETNVRSADGKR
ncbi:MAG: tetraacyldisaccharide 4'-kinase [Silvanigrellaceae bacterium]